MFKWKIDFLWKTIANELFEALWFKCGVMDGIFTGISRILSSESFLGILHILSRVYNKIVAYYAPTYTALHKLILIPIKAQTQKLKEMY